jgi:hypothetical protein
MAKRNGTKRQTIVNKTLHRKLGLSSMTSDYHFGIFKLLAIVMSVLRFMTSDYHFGIFKLLAIVMSVLLFMTSDYHFGIFKLLAIVMPN